ncbi:hypothetical protein N7468_007428 [Penicillium chermesinum]|uniref:SH3 domain-containing protein n=1 Tax=Penicillium chermesinum TaxID=63820 RepID=A0A9W9TKN4_9EURO|nr:uncharacterized protein N7468_007428 [Penicillium chermesinum]KAJ5226203.1 hypothetical protein N7468_007428 [Penicillium chermesinum]
MTRPQIIRADTLDLQDHGAPSAQDHTRQPESTAPLGVGRPAPHQEQAIRHAERDTKLEIMGGPGDDEYLDSIDGYMESDDLMDDDMMDKISSSPSIDDEDIDFEFVYALHNFVATVDGQANAAKGDTMVLLDDSNSYWWLVRVVKDGSIGYLPAEHIETPTERLARLNKHRNVDLSATMLGDNNEKSKNPLKKAMRRRNAKTVNFAAPTYIEASDQEYSSDEDSEHGDFFNDDETETVESEEGDSQDQAEEIVVEPLRPKGHKEKPVEQVEINISAEQQETTTQQTSAEARRSSEEFFDSEEPIVSRSRNGTVRNTDSFFKDDTAEPKKISLTPNLLRDESNGGSGSGGLKEWQEPRASLESLEKGSSHDKGKEDKKRKEKKSGMLSGLFKRKDKKKSSVDEEVDESITSPIESTFRASESSSRSSPQPKESMESLSQEQKAKPQKFTNAKLQKNPPPIITSTSTMSPTSTTMSPTSPVLHKDNEHGQTIRRVASQDAASFESRGSVASPVSQASPSNEAYVTPFESQDPFASPEERRPSSEAQWRGPQEAPAPVQQANGQRSVTSPSQKFTPQAAPAPARPEPEPEYSGRISPGDGHIPILAPGITPEYAQRAGSISPPSPPSSPEIDVNELAKRSEPAPASVSTLSVDTPTWSDASLRSYLDDENDIRDLFIIVHDKSNIPPAGADHPVTGRLFKEESKRLKEMNNQLDEMLVRWMSQRKRTSNTLRSVQSPA